MSYVVKKKVSKTKRLIGFCFIGRTHRDHAGKYFTETTGNPALSSPPLFFYTYVYMYVLIYRVFQRLIIKFHDYAAALGNETF